jgi:transglutaminase-like putative cysteine protease
MSNRENIQNDPISRLAYLGYALGIHAVLNTVLLPLIRDYATTFNNESESLLFSKLSSKVEDDMYKSMIHTINYVKGKEKEEAYAGLEKTAKEVIKAVDRSGKEIRELAVELSRKFPAGDFKQARRLYEYVRDEIQYIYDPLGIEEIQSPQLTLRLGSGDCDDKAILLTSLLMAIGFESSLIFADTDGDGLPDHVYSAVHLPNAPEYCKPFPHKEMLDGKDFHDWVPLDPTFQDSDFGVIPIIDLEGIKLVPVMFK